MSPVQSAIRHFILEGLADDYARDPPAHAHDLTLLALRVAEMGVRGSLTIVVPIVLVLLAGGQPPAPPQLHVEAPAALAGARSRIEAVDPQNLARLVQFFGLPDAGPPIRVLLASDSSDWARRTPPWTVGLALGASGVVIIFPSRTPVYPHDTIEDVLRHEVAHVLIARAAGDRPIPRWFHEGLAMAVERGWDLEDRAHVAYELASGPRINLEAVNQLFAGGRRDQARAYAVAGAFVRDVLAEDGSRTAAGILRRVAGGVPFHAAFADVTGVTLADAEAGFWRRQRLWTTWVPWLTSTTALWLAVTLLALYAIRKQRQKRLALRRRWADTEADESPDDAGSIERP